MIPVLTAGEMRRIDEDTIGDSVPGLTLMENAGQGVTEELLKILNRNKKKDPDTYLGTALVAAMTGNPVGIDMFIEAATFETEEGLSITETDQIIAENFKESARGWL